MVMLVLSLLLNATLLGAGPVHVGLPIWATTVAPGELEYGTDEDFTRDDPPVSYVAPLLSWTSKPVHLREVRSPVLPQYDVGWSWTDSIMTPILYVQVYCPLDSDYVLNETRVYVRWRLHGQLHGQWQRTTLLQAIADHDRHRLPITVPPDAQDLQVIARAEGEAFRIVNARLYLDAHP